MPHSKGPCFSSETRGSRSHRNFSPTALTAFLSPLPALRAGREDVPFTSVSGLACSSEQLVLERTALAVGSRVWQLPVMAGQVLLPRGPCYSLGAGIRLCHLPPRPPARAPAPDQRECVRLVCEKGRLAAHSPDSGGPLAICRPHSLHAWEVWNRVLHKTQ